MDRRREVFYHNKEKLYAHCDPYPDHMVIDIYFIGPPYASYMALLSRINLFFSLNLATFLSTFLTLSIYPLNIYKFHLLLGGDLVSYFIYFGSILFLLLPLTLNNMPLIVKGEIREEKFLPSPSA